MAYAVCGAYDNGTLVVRGQVRDKDGGQSVYTTPVTVSNVAPTVFIDAVNTSTTNSLTRSITTHFSDPGASDGVAPKNLWPARVDWGDGLATTFNMIRGTSYVPAHTYRSAGTYTIVVKVTDKDGGVGSVSVKVKV